ncbi:MAG: hypothetical protein V4541_10495 [Bacteroidota bacterium]
MQYQGLEDTLEGLHQIPMLKNTMQLAIVLNQMFLKPSFSKSAFTVPKGFKVKKRGTGSFIRS